MNVKPVIPEIITFIIGLIVLAIYACNDTVEMKAFVGTHRVIIALSTAAVSQALPGILTIGKPEVKTRQIEQRINAAGALAVFIVVYLFNPISI